MDTTIILHGRRWNGKLRAMVLDLLSSEDGRSDLRKSYHDVPNIEDILHDWLTYGPNLDELKITLDDYVRTALSMGFSQKETI